MKKILYAFLAVCLFACSASNVFAQGEIAKLSLDYTVKDNGNVVVTAAVVDISDPSGILILFYDISFDNTKLEVVGSTVNMPSEWKPFEDIGMSEVLFSQNQNSDKYVWWSTYAGEADQGYGITEDNEFRIEIEFKPLANCETSVNFVSDSVYTDADIYLENPLKTESKSILIKAEANANPESSEGAESEELSSSEEFSETVSDDVSSDVSERTETSSNVESSSQEGKSEASDENGAGESSETLSESVISDAAENASAEDESIETSAESLISQTDEESNTDNDKNNNSNAVTIIVISVLAVALISGVIIYIIKSKKVKK